MKLSAVVACYRDAPAVPIMYERLVRAFHEVGADYEIIFVNDGSPDNAREVLADLAQRDPNVVVVNHARAFGSQSAFTSGMRIATGDAVVLLDGDLQDPPELIGQFVAHWRKGYDVVYGERIKREASFFMRHAYRAFYRVFKRLAYVNVPLDAGDFSLIDRRVVDAMNALPETHRFVRGLRAWVGYKQLGVPYVRPERMFGKSTNSLRKNLGWARRAIVSLSYAPLDLITGLALCGRGRRIARSDRAARPAEPPGSARGAERPDDGHLGGPVHRWHPASVSGDHRVLSRPHVRGGKGPAPVRGRVGDQCARRRRVPGSRRHDGLHHRRQLRSRMVA